MTIDGKVKPQLDAPDIAQIEAFLNGYREYIAQTGHHVSMAHYSVMVMCKDCREKYNVELPHKPKHEPYFRRKEQKSYWGWLR